MIRGGRRVPPMELIEFLVALLVAVASVGAITLIVVNNNTKRLRASSPPPAGVLSTDSAAVVRAKRSTYRQVTEAVRILESIMRQDALVPILDEQTRDETRSFLAEYYRNI